MVPRGTGLKPIQSTIHLKTKDETKTNDNSTCKKFD
jgi:hypothetical protein